MRAATKNTRSESGIALLTTILLMLLMSSLLVGFMLLIVSGQRLTGAGNDYTTAFYAAEAGMEKLTADLGTLFDQNYAPTGAQITALQATPPPIGGISYTTSSGGSGYAINVPAANLDPNGNPLATVTQIKSGPYQGMTALATPYTMDVVARTTAGSEVKLERTTQTVGIPMFQFGIYSDSDLSFFPGPNFNFGGRTHTNGNLFLAAGSTLTLSGPVTAVKDVIRYSLENGNPVTNGYPGTVNVFNGAGVRALATTEGSLTKGLLSPANANWSNISLGASYYAGNLRNGTTGARALQLGIVTLGGGATQEIDVIRRPKVGEAPTVTQERYFAQASLKILLSDNPTDITNLPCTSATPPYNLAHLNANFLSGPNTDANTVLIKTNLTGHGEIFVPLAMSGSVLANNQYTPSTRVPTPASNNNTPPVGDGYWQPNGSPIITGFIKIEIQKLPYNTCNFQDVTEEVLGYGYVGKNANPIGNLVVANQTIPTSTAATPVLPLLPTAIVGSLTAGAAGADSCPDGHPLAIIRFQRVRDNPSAGGTDGNGHCGTSGGVLLAALAGDDFWPNALYDTREGLSNNNTPTGTLASSKTNNAVAYGSMVNLGGVMQYVEVDVKNLAKYLSGGSTVSSYDPSNAPNNYAVYISDRRGNYYNGANGTAFAGTWPPLSPSGNETGEYGFGDFVNFTDTNGCPNKALDTGEDLAGTGILYTYGQYANHTMLPANLVSPWLGGYGPFAGLYYPPGSSNPQSPEPTTYAFAPNLYAGTGTYNCGVTDTSNPYPAGVTGAPVWPGTFVIHANEARQNPNFFFRRAVKLVNGSNLLANLNTCPGGIPCGLTIAAENPVYIQGDYNCPGCTGTAANTSDVGTSVIGDAVTMLSNNWNDVNSFSSPYSLALRTAVTTYYRTAIVGGKGVYFPQQPGTAQDFGTDGGVHNFLRYLENWGGAGTNLIYDGSLVSLYYNRQAIGIYKSGGGVYSPPSRFYTFDDNFTQPSLLPPRTPLFRDINTTGFTQLLGPTQ